MLLRTLLCLVLLLSARLYATETIEMVRFSPPLILNNSLECQGVRISLDRLAMTTECVTAERRYKGNTKEVVGLDDQRKGILVSKVTPSM